MAGALLSVVLPDVCGGGSFVGRGLRKINRGPPRGMKLASALLAYRRASAERRGSSLGSRDDSIGSTIRRPKAGERFPPVPSSSTTVAGVPQRALATATPSADLTFSVSFLSSQRH